jgi:hypothetical protein
MQNELEAFEFLRGDAVDGMGVRVNKKIAKKWLLENKGIICGGTVFYLKIKNLGMGVYNVTKAPLTVRETLMIK